MTMPVKFEISVVLVGKSLKITIPVEIAKHLNLARGNTVYVYVDNNRMIVEKKDKIIKEIDRSIGILVDYIKSDYKGW